jgi:hypothetical protein
MPHAGGWGGAGLRVRPQGAAALPSAAKIGERCAAARSLWRKCAARWRSAALLMLALAPLLAGPLKLRGASGEPPLACGLPARTGARTRWQAEVRALLRRAPPG